MLQVIKWAFYILYAFSTHMGIDLRCFTVFMPQQFLYLAKIGAGLQQMGGKTIT